MDQLRDFLRESRRRSLWRVLAVYLLASWFGYEIILALVEGLGLPDWFPSFAIVLFIIGLPIVLATAFVQQRGPLSVRLDPTLLPGLQEGEDPAPKGARRLFTWRNALLGGVFAFALWGLVAAVWIVRGGATRADAGDDGAPSIAVLPFVNMSTDKADEYFSDGITEEIITRLSQVQSLRVISRSATFRYKESQIDPRQLGAELGVSAILEGSVQRRGDRLRITAQLINVEDGFHLWSDRYDREYSDLFAIQDNVASNIAAALRVKLGAGDEAALSRRGTENLEAYEHYSRARFEFYKYTQDGNAAAMELFQKALELDPEYALALAGLSLAQTQYINRSWSDDLAWLDKAEQNARRALEIAPDLAEAHFALGFMYEQREMWDEEEVEMKAVLAVNPNHAHAHDSLGDVYRVRGWFDQALAEYEIALRLDPYLAPSIWCIGDVYQLRGQYEEALRQYARMREVHPRLAVGYSGRGHVLAARGQLREAVAAFRQALEVEPDVGAFVGLANAQIALGDLVGARATADAVRRAAPERTPYRAAYTYILGRIAGAQGQTGAAIEQYRTAASSHQERRGPFFRGSAGPVGYELALADAYTAAGQPDRAVETLRAAQREYRSVKLLHYYSGIALEAAGHRGEAAAQYREFLDAWQHADADAPALVDAKKRLAALLAA